VDETAKQMGAPLAAIGARHSATVLQCTPSLLRMLDTASAELVARTLRVCLPSQRTSLSCNYQVCAMGGERVPHPAHLQPPFAAKWLRGGLRILNLYGITELSVVRSELIVRSSDDVREIILQWATCYEVPPGLQGESRTVPIGNPLSDTHVFLRPMEEAETRKRKADAAEVDDLNSKAGTADEDVESGVIWLRGLRGRRCHLSGEKEAVWYAGCRNTPVF
jgi:acyl-CoA synthetase (AMP-forming)/AMP-acid ligase II